MKVVSEAQKRASAKYNKEKVKQEIVRFYPGDANIHAWLCAQPNKAGYIKQLIREDMERNSEVK